jgi:sugar/nucleoside kinase (ribokinase family)
MFDILVAGELNPDLILSGNITPEFNQVEKLVDSATLTIGSSSAIFASQAALLGLKVAFIGVCGDDLFGRFMLEKMQGRGVDISNVILNPDGQTGLSVILNRGDDRAILTHSGLIGSLRAMDVTDNLIRLARHLHVASYFIQNALRPGLRDLFGRARSADLSTSLDTNWDPSGEWHGVDELLQLTDIFLPNEKEALAMGAAPVLENALQILSHKCKVVAVKCGKGGAYAIQGGISAYAPALEVQVVDTVGAGDNFDAGFLYGWLKGWDLKMTLKLATACGSLSTQGEGGVSAQPTLEEAIKYVESVG